MWLSLLCYIPVRCGRDSHPTNRVALNPSQSREMGQQFTKLEGNTSMTFKKKGRGNKMYGRGQKP